MNSDPRSLVTSGPIYICSTTYISFTLSFLSAITAAWPAWLMFSCDLFWLDLSMTRLKPVGWWLVIMQNRATVLNLNLSRFDRHPLLSKITRSSEVTLRKLARRAANMYMYCKNPAEEAWPSGLERIFYPLVWDLSGLQTITNGRKHYVEYCVHKRKYGCSTTESFSCYTTLLHCHWIIEQWQAHNSIPTIVSKQVIDELTILCNP